MEKSPGTEFQRHAYLTRLPLVWLMCCLLALNGSAAQSEPSLVLPPVWHWSNPAPHGADIFAMVHDRRTDSFLEVCEQGQIFSSHDGVSWTPLQTHTTANLQGAAIFNGRVIVTGEAGTILYSDDLYNWHSSGIAITNWLEGVAASTNLAVAVGDSAAMYTSSNAVNWQPVNLAFTNWLTGIAFGASNTFVTVGYNGLIAKSTNGATWTTVTSGTKTNLFNVTWIGNQFIAIGAGGVTLSSTNGASWHSVGEGATNALYAVAGGTNMALIAGASQLFLEKNNIWSNQITAPTASAAPNWNYYADVSTTNSTNAFLAGGQTGFEIMSSNVNNSIQWITPSPAVRSWLWQVIRLPDYYVSVGNYGTVMTSADGIDWELEYVPDSATNSVLLGVGGNTNIVVAAGTRGTVLWGTNAFLWNSIPAPTTNDLEGVLYDGSQFILCGGNGTLLTSATGTNWTKRTTGTTSFLSGIASFPGGWVAVGDNGTILLSSNRTTWKSQTSKTTNWLSDVAWLGNTLIAVGENGAILTSPNGSTWTAQSSGTTSWLNSVDFVSNTWFVTGNSGTVLGSQDLIAWANFTTLTFQPLYGVAHNQQQLVVVGADGVILRSQLVQPSSPVQISDYSSDAHADVFLFTGLPDQQFFLESSPDLRNWTQGPMLDFFDSTGTLIYVQPHTNASPALFFRTQAAQ